MPGHRDLSGIAAICECIHAVSAVETIALDIIDLQHDHCALRPTNTAFHCRTTALAVYTVQVGGGAGDVAADLAISVQVGVEAGAALPIGGHVHEGGHIGVVWGEEDIKHEAATMVRRAFRTCQIHHTHRSVKL